MLLPTPAGSGARAPPRVLKSTTRWLHETSGVADRVGLAFTDCLGRCGRANMMLLELHGRPLWFRRMNAPELVEVFSRVLLDRVVGLVLDCVTEGANDKLNRAESGEYVGRVLPDALVEIDTMAGIVVPWRRCQG